MNASEIALALTSGLVDRESLTNALRDSLGGETLINWVFDGDSITNGFGVTEAERWPSVLLGLPFINSRGASYVVATDSATLAGRTSAYTADVFPKRPNGATIKEAWLFMWIGANDFFNYTAATVPTYMTSLESYWNTAKADGFKVVAFTISRRNDQVSNAAELARNLINENIRKSAVWDYLVDADLVMTDPTNYMYSAAVHPSVVGHRIIAYFVNSALVCGSSFIKTQDYIYPQKFIEAVGTTSTTLIPGVGQNTVAFAVNFAAAASTKTITHGNVAAGDICICSVATVDDTAKSCVAVCTATTITLTLNAAATAETRVNCLILK